MLCSLSTNHRARWPLTWFGSTLRQDTGCSGCHYSWFPSCFPGKFRNVRHWVMVAYIHVLWNSLFLYGPTIRRYCFIVAVMYKIQTHRCTAMLRLSDAGLSPWRSGLDPRLCMIVVDKVAPRYAFIWVLWLSPVSIILPLLCHSYYIIWQLTVSLRNAHMYYMLLKFYFNYLLVYAAFDNADSSSEHTVSERLITTQRNKYYFHI